MVRPCIDSIVIKVGDFGSGDPLHPLLWNALVDHLVDSRQIVCSLQCNNYCNTMLHCAHLYVVALKFVCQS